MDQTFDCYVISNEQAAILCMHTGYPPPGRSIIVGQLADVAEVTYVLVNNINGVFTVGRAGEWIVSQSA